MSAASALSPYPIDHEARRGTAPSAQESVADKVRVGGSATIRVVATSMFPWIRPGDQAFIRRYDFSQINSGDVILYERANRLFIHRVIRRITRPGLGGDADPAGSEGRCSGPARRAGVCQGIPGPGHPHSPRKAAHRSAIVFANGLRKISGWRFRLNSIRVRPAPQSPVQQLALKSRHFKY